MESWVAEESAGRGADAGESGMTPGDQHFLCLLLSFVLLVSLLMRECGLDEELAGVGMAGGGMGTAAGESGMIVGDHHFLCLLLSFVFLLMMEGVVDE